MRAFSCPNCAALIFFENSVCVTCSAAIGFLRPIRAFALLQPVAGGATAYRHGDGTVWVPCANLHLAWCNWLADANAANGLCSCCALTRTRPADADRAGLAAFARTEAAKRRLLFQLDELGLPTTSRAENPTRGLMFDLLASSNQTVVTGHDHGLITIDLAEGDDPHREAVRASLGEAYRTVLGHLRHEIGHWYWEILVEPSPHLAAFREIFGDETRDYGQALWQHYAGKGHYAGAGRGGWRTAFVSDYAAAHPWEDWAECFAHYLHMTDTLQTASSYGVTIGGPNPGGGGTSLVGGVSAPSAHYDNFDEMLSAWLTLSYALNAMNRSMGMNDVYPFVLVPAVIEKLRFVHTLVRAG